MKRTLILKPVLTRPMQCINRQQTLKSHKKTLLSPQNTVNRTQGLVSALGNTAEKHVNELTFDEHVQYNAWCSFLQGSSHIRRCAHVNTAHNLHLFTGLYE